MILFFGLFWRIGRIIFLLHMPFLWGPRCYLLFLVRGALVLTTLILTTLILTTLILSTLVI
jgi:hypothetical protein